MIREAILRGADVYDAQDAFDEDQRNAYLNASEAMTCIRKQWYAKHGADKDGPENWGYARRGKHGEKYIVERLRLANVAVLFGGDEQVKIVDDDLRISCTPDGLVWDEDGWLACEFKTKDPRTNMANLPREEHVRQVQIAAAMFEKHRDEFPELGDAPIKGCMVVYMDASNYDDITEEPVPLKPRILDQLGPRARRVLDTKEASRLPREGAQTPYKAECKQRCQFNRVCGVDGAGSSTGQGRKGAGDAAVQVNAYLNAKVIEAAAKADKERAAEHLKALLQREGAASVEVDGHTVSLSKRAGSVSYVKVVKDHCPDVDLEPYRGSPSETLSVK